MRLVPPDELSSVWWFVERGLHQILKRTKENWTATHVRFALNKGLAHLFIDDDGFVVLQRQEDPWTADPYVHVWAMWFEPTKAREKRAEISKWLDEVSGRKCKFSSPRMGWKALEPDWEIERIVWRRKT